MHGINYYSQDIEAIVEDECPAVRFVAETFQRVLGLDRVDRCQGLFELGGDSLAAARIVTMREQAFNVRLDLQEALASFTVDHVAVLVDAQLVAAVEQVSEDEAVRLLQRVVDIMALLGRFPGIHEVGMRRDVAYVVDVSSPAFVQALEDAVVAVMIEKASAVENVEAMLSVKGVDMVQFGPADYSMSIGIPGQWNHPRVKETEAHVIKTALRLGVAPRVEIDTPDQARPYLDMGVRHFCMGWDVGILFEWFKSQGTALRAMVKT